MTLSTAMPLSASSSSASRYHSPNRGWQRTADASTSGGNRRPANAGPRAGPGEATHSHGDSLAARPRSQETQQHPPKSGSAVVRLGRPPPAGDGDPIAAGLALTGPLTANPSSRGRAHRRRRLGPTTL